MIGGRSDARLKSIILNKVGLSSDPCDMPLLISVLLEVVPLILICLTLSFYFAYNELQQFSSPIFAHQRGNNVGGTLSNTDSKSIINAIVTSSLKKPLNIFSMKRKRVSVVSLWGLNPNWYKLSRCECSSCQTSLLLTAHSNNLLRTERSEMAQLWLPFIRVRIF